MLTAAVSSGVQVTNPARAANSAPVSPARAARSPKRSKGLPPCNAAAIRAPTSGGRPAAATIDPSAAREAGLPAINVFRLNHAA